MSIAWHRSAGRREGKASWLCGLRRCAEGAAIYNELLSEGRLDFDTRRQVQEFVFKTGA